MYVRVHMCAARATVWLPEIQTSSNRFLKKALVWRRCAASERQSSRASEPQTIGNRLVDFT